MYCNFFKFTNLQTKLNNLSNESLGQRQNTTISVQQPKQPIHKHSAKVAQGQWSNYSKRADKNAIIAARVGTLANKYREKAPQQKWAARIETLAAEAKDLLP